MRSIGAEIGVHIGEFSSRILDIAQPVKLHLIDPWKYQEGEPYELSFYGGEKGGNQENMDMRYKQVLNRFSREIRSESVFINRDFSYRVSQEMPSSYLDWIYIDGGHSYEVVKKDLQLSYKVVRHGGLITGDDYREGGWWRGGVKKAVNEFVKKMPVQLVDIKRRQFIIRKE